MKSEFSLAAEVAGAGLQQSTNKPPISVDVTEVCCSDWEAYGETELRLRLEERYPAGPDEWSGVTLTFNDSGECSAIGASIGYDEASQKLNNGSHCLGVLYGTAAQAFLRDALALVGNHQKIDYETVTVELLELYPMVTDRLSGARLRCSGRGRDAELTVDFGSHCFGAARGSVLWKFLSLAKRRASKGA